MKFVGVSLVFFKVELDFGMGGKFGVLFVEVIVLVVCFVLSFMSILKSFIFVGVFVGIVLLVLGVLFFIVINDME